MSLLLQIINTKRWLLCCLLFFLSACIFKSPNKVSSSAGIDSIRQEEKIGEALTGITRAKEYVKQGDLIMRTGRDFTSELMRLSSSVDKTYSHCGIAAFENDTLFVYHALGGEWNPDQKLRRDLFELFCNPYESRSIGIFRYGLNTNEKVKLFKTVHNLYASGVMFDMQFDLASDDRMYCSEFIYKCIKQATDDRIKIPLTSFNNIKFVAPDNLYLNSFCKEVLRLKFPIQ